MIAPPPDPIPEETGVLVREQIEILWHYGRENRTMNAAFVHDHARMIVQLTSADPGPHWPKDPPTSPGRP